MTATTCNCDRGYRLCPEAVQLWQAAGAAYRAASVHNTSQTWTAYDAALDEYRQHFDPTFQRVS